MMKKLIAGLLLAALSPLLFAQAANVYIAQTAAGSANGSSCANARAATYFNTGANWGNGATQIGAGTVVRLCGTVTTNLQFQNSGTSGNPVVLDGTGATLGISQGIDTANQIHWTIRNLTWAVGSNAGAIIEVRGGSNGLIDNVTALGTESGIFISAGNVPPTNITIRNSRLVSTCADLGNTQHDLITTEGSTNVVIEGNYLEHCVDGAGGNAHNDIIQTYKGGCGSCINPAGWTIRHNRFLLSCTASNDRAWLVLENHDGQNYVYGNVFEARNGCGSSANGLCCGFFQTGGVLNVYGNTIVAKNGAQNLFNFTAPGTLNIINNVVHMTSNNPMTGTMTVNRSYNIWFGANSPSCAGVTGEQCNVNPLFVDYANDNFTLAANSPARGVGTVLGAPYNKYVRAGATWPNPLLGTRAVSGAWTKGAYGTLVAAPTNPQ